jgi:hypothetical protein
LAASTNKKVQVHRFDREAVAGFVNPLTFQTDRGIELLDVTGNLVLIPYSEIKLVHFVKDFETMPNGKERKAFLTRPKMDGLWVRLDFRDGDCMEGVLANNLLPVDLYGFMMTPPDFTYNNLRMFVPRAALTGIQVLGVVGSALRKSKALGSGKQQIRLFE